MTETALLTLIILLPFIAALALLAVRVMFSPAVQEQTTRFVSILTPTLVALLTVILFILFDAQAPYAVALFQWISIGTFTIDISLLLDPLSAWMILFITLIAALIFIYATGYMRKDPSYTRFFIYFHLFLGSMLLLVLAENPFVMFLGWEGVGVCSYLLIGFFMQDRSNISAANKAFFVNRVGDFGFLIALALIFVSFGDTGLSFLALESHISLVEPDTLFWIALLLFVGAMGKSAQIPLYIWLPDAMAGPTPVSALIHAATMVTAGVYMVARFSFLYTLTPDVSLFIAYIGVASALLAALFASFESDIKKILAYSTMSQLGYMFVAVGLGAYSGAIFHLFTHAFFKALLFMGAGAVIIALHHEQNIFKMGGMKHFLAPVYVSMFFACLTISGIPPFSGFISKDAILAQSFFNGHYTIWAIATVTSFLTAYYMFRLFFTVFTAPSANERPHIHEVPFSMQWPLILLALAAAVNGIWNLPHFMGGGSMAASFLQLPDTSLHATVSEEWTLTLFSVAVALSGLFLAYIRFGTLPQESHSPFVPVKMLRDKLYVDKVYHLIFVTGLQSLSTLLIRVIEPTIMLFVKSAVRFYQKLAYYVDTLQSGDARSYLIYIVSGIFMLSIYLYVILELAL